MSGYVAWYGMSSRGLPWHRLTWLGIAWHGLAWVGMVLLGIARRGCMACHASCVSRDLKKKSALVGLV